MPNYTQTKETLDNLYVDLKKQYDSAFNDFKHTHYKSASKKFALALGQGERDLLIADKELNIPFSGLEQEKISRDEALAAYNKVNNILTMIRKQKNTCDQDYSTSEVLDEMEQENKRINEINKKRAIAERYEHSFALLTALKKQPEPLAGVEDKLTAFLTKVKELRMDNSVSVADLTKTMDVAYDRLTGGSKKEFDKFTNRMYAQHSIPLKILGAALVLLGAALVASAIIFAPAVITAASAGLATVYVAAATATAASVALGVGGTFSFFHQTESMKLAKAAKEVGDTKLEERAYTPTAPRP